MLTNAFIGAVKSPTKIELAAKLGAVSKLWEELVAGLKRDRPDFTYDELEEYGQWEMLCWIALAGAMTEIGAKVRHSDLLG